MSRALRLTVGVQDGVQEPAGPSVLLLLFPSLV